MEIGRVRRGNITSERKVVSEKKDFSQSFSQERHKKSEEQLNKMIDDIKKRGSKLITTKTYVDVIMYKKMIKEYLESILKYMYETKKDISFWQTQYFITVDTVDNKLEELTKGLLSDEKDNINIASTIDEIQGMIVDIYRQYRRRLKNEKERDAVDFSYALSDDDALEMKATISDRRKVLKVFSDGGVNVVTYDRNGKCRDTKFSEAFKIEGVIGLFLETDNEDSLDD